MLRLAAFALALLAQEEERGRFVIYILGEKSGTEEYRIEKFPEGGTGVFSKTRLSTEVRGRKIEISNDTALTLDKDGHPSLYAGVAKGPDRVLETRMAIKDGQATIEVRVPPQGVRRSARLAPDAFILDNEAYIQFALIARAYDAAKGGVQPVRTFGVRNLAEVAGSVEDRGEAALRSGDRTVAVRHRLLKIGRLGVSVYLREDGGVAAIDSRLQGVIAFAPDQAGWEIVPDGPDIRRPAGVEETEVAFRSGKLTMAGSLTRPEGSARLPAVVLIGGSGPNDRDANAVPEKAKGTVAETVTWKGTRWNLFRSVAYALSAGGIVVLRYDKRGVGRSEGDFATARLSDFADDAGAAVAYLRSRDDVDPDRIGLVGHSEGAVIAPLLANRDPRLRAIFLMAGTGKPFGDVMIEQVERLMREQGLAEDLIQKQLKRQREQLAAVRETSGDFVDVDGQRMFVGWLREHLDHDPAAEIRNVRAPVVVMQGMKDEQVFPDNAGLLEEAMKAAGKTNFEVRRFDELDHLFMKWQTGIADYADPARRADDGFLSFLVDKVRHWMK